MLCLPKFFCLQYGFKKQSDGIFFLNRQLGIQIFQQSKTLRADDAILGHRAAGHLLYLRRGQVAKVA